MAVEQVGTLNPQFLSRNTTNKLTDLSSLGYSTIGPQLLQTILSTTFKGLTGDFNLINGQLQSSAFQIFNIIREEERVIGYWTPMKGISRQLNTKNKLTSMSNLKAILWPGDSINKPKGWDILTNGKEYLKVLVPNKHIYGFSQYLSIERDPITKKATNFTGFCIELFGNLTSRLPFGLPYQYQAYPLDGKSIHNYGEMIDEVYYMNFDAVVGDISILANRSNYVDFTMPYTEFGVTMVVAMKDNLEKEFWMFVKPLSLGVWLVTFAGFVYIGVVVWILEHPTNTEFGASHRERIEKSIWYSFSTLVFSQHNGGVAAIFDELPYVQVFLNMYCNRYTTVGRTYSSEGFGFVFPKGSPLVSYMSRAIVNITDDGTLDKIKQRWLQNQTNCNNNADVSSTSTNQLTLRSPGGLFLIIGVISGLSLLIHLFLFVYGSWHVQTTRMFLRSSWRNVRHMIIYITNSLRRRYHVTEVGPMESQPTVTRDIEEGTVKEEFGSMELQQRGAKHREEPIVEECIVEGGGIVEEENTVEGLSRRCLKVNIDGTDYDHYPRLPITNNVARWTSIRPWKYCQECITPLWKNKNETTY
ncbi:glutamate receptor 2.9-like isoform X2 [Macadamia integrifolia]|uniref:glutamate receptor 2.9-like isoform X2 n=1 Tax=Macadamia integrifolia TaxID=60698 RepID=UPI001C4F56AA|nr:glutamate receptor 2.9-like isoform X2 [Macadamia integrifolia]